MRLLLDGHTLNDHFTGIGRYIYHLIEGIAQRAPHDQIIVPLNPRLPNRRFDLKLLARFPNVTLIETNLSPFKPQFQFALKSYLPRPSFDLIHFPYYLRPYFGYQRTALSLLDLIPLKFPQALPSTAHKLLYRLLTELAVRQSQLIFTTSAASQRDLQACFDLHRKLVSVTLLAAEARFQPAPPSQTAAIRAHFDLPEKFLLTLCTNKPHKNLSMLIQAFAKTKDVPSLVLAGFYDPRYPNPQTQATALGIAERVRFLGAVRDDDLPALYSAATAFVFPSLYEGFGLPVLEAMACGAPVICSNSSSLPEVAGDAAILLAPTDLQGWCEAMQRISADATLRAQLSERSLRQAARFTWQATAQQAYVAYLQAQELW